MMLRVKMQNRRDSPVGRGVDASSYVLKKWLFETMKKLLTEDSAR